MESANFKFDDLYNKKIIAHNLKATKEQILDELNGFMPPLQRKIMKELLQHVDELNTHINHLDDDIDNHMKPEEKQEVEAITEVTGIGAKSVHMWQQLTPC